MSVKCIIKFLQECFKTISENNMNAIYLQQCNVLFVSILYMISIFVMNLLLLQNHNVIIMS